MSMGAMQAIIGAVGVGGSIYEGLQMKKTESAIGRDQWQLKNEEQQNLDVQRQQQTLDYTRQTRAIARNAIQTSAQSKAASVASGSQFGSGEAGGQAQIKASAGTNQVSLNQNYQLGQKAFDIASTEISTAQDIGQLQTQASGEAASASMWAALTGQAGAISSSLSSAGGSISSMAGGGMGSPTDMGAGK